MTLNKFVAIGIMRALIDATNPPKRNKKRNKHQRMRHREYMREYMRKRRAGP